MSQMKLNFYSELPINDGEIGSNVLGFLLPKTPIHEGLTADHLGLGGSLFYTDDNGKIYRIPDYKDIYNLKSIVYELQGGTKLTVVPDISARDALVNAAVGSEVYVIDASADTSVTSGGARYLKQENGWIKTAQSVQQATSSFVKYYGINSSENGPNYRGEGATGDGSIAIGYDAKAARQNAIAIGRYASVTATSTGDNNPHGIAIGGGQTNNPSITDIDKQNDAATAGRNVVAIGYNVKMGGAAHSFGFGTNIVVKGVQNFVLSAAGSASSPTKVYGQTNTVIGANNKLDGQHYYKTLGTYEKYYGDIANNLVFGDGNTVAGTANINATASTYSGDKGAYKNVILGSSNQLMGNNYRNNLLASNATLKLGANNNTLLGSGITVNAGVYGSYVLGNNVNVTANNSVYFGDTSVATLEPTTTGDVLNGQTKVTGLTHEGLEDFSTLSSEQLNEIITAGERGQTSITIRGKKYNFAGLGQNNGGVISVGKISVVDGENVSYGRVVQNVAPGLVGAKSTDAVNGSQLYAIYKSIDDVISEKVPEDVLTLSKLDSFPVKPYENGTTIIAKQGDEYIKIDTNLKPIQDLTLKASIGNTTTYVGDPNTVVFTLTNVGNQICNSATVNITLPSNTDSYTISSQTHALYSTGNVTVEGSSYTVTNFNPNDTLVITIKFIGNSVGGFTFSGTVTTTDVELINTNNTATVQVSTREAVNTNTETITANTFTVPPRVRSGNDGPELVVTEETSGKQLRVISTESIYSDDLSIDQLVQNYFHYTNVIALPSGKNQINLVFDTEVDYVDIFPNIGYLVDVDDGSTYGRTPIDYYPININYLNFFNNSRDYKLHKKSFGESQVIKYTDSFNSMILFNHPNKLLFDYSNPTIARAHEIYVNSNLASISQVEEIFLNYTVEKKLFNSFESFYSPSEKIYFSNNYHSSTKFEFYSRPILINKLSLDNSNFLDGTAVQMFGLRSQYVQLTNSNGRSKLSININEIRNYFDLDISKHLTDFFIKVRPKGSNYNYQVIHLYTVDILDNPPNVGSDDTIYKSTSTVTNGEVNEIETVYKNIPGFDNKRNLADYTYINAMNFVNVNTPDDLVGGVKFGSTTTYIQDFVAKPNSEFVIDITNSGEILDNIENALDPYIDRTIYSGIYITDLGSNRYQVVVGPNCTAEDNIVTEYIKFSVDTSTTTE